MLKKDKIIKNLNIQQIIVLLHTKCLTIIRENKYIQLTFGLIFL